MKNKPNFISIILPIKNEAGYIAETLKSIFDQNVSKDKFEIIIADGRSTDNTLEIINQIILSNPDINIIIIDNPEEYVPTGFNRALSISKGNVILRIDGHCKIKDGYIDNCLSVFDKIEADCVGGAIENLSNSFIGNIICKAQSSIFGVGGVSFRKKNESGKFVDTLAFGAYKRKVFDLIGGYDEELIRNQDDEFNFRLIQKGMKIWLDPSINSVYFTRTSLLKLSKQYYGYGFYKVRVMQKRKSFSSWRHIIPVSFVLSLMISSILSILSLSNIIFLMIIIPYLFICLFFSFILTLECLKEKISLKKVILTPVKIIVFCITFFTLHFSYGYGFLIGFFSFINRWNDNSIKDHNFDKNKFQKQSDVY